MSTNLPMPPISSAFRRGFDHDGPTIGEIPVGDLPSPWHPIDMPPVQKIKQQCALIAHSLLIFQGGDLAI
jgi:hypothetical protein